MLRCATCLALYGLIVHAVAGVATAAAVPPMIAVAPPARSAYRLEDRMLITDWTYRYAALVDHKVFDARFLDLFTDTAVLDYLDTAKAKGSREEMAAWLSRLLSVMGYVPAAFTGRESRSVGWVLLVYLHGTSGLVRFL